ncbi:hypothetical protein POPTR_002G073450v4, partial [Populus trichocarpa]
QSAFIVGVLFDLYAFHRFTRNFLCPYPLGFDNNLKKPPIYALYPIILDNTCILCIIMTVGTKLADAYSLDIVIAFFSRKRSSQLTQASPHANSSFFSSTYGVLVVIFGYCSPLKGKFVHVTHLFTTENIISRLTCMC